MAISLEYRKNKWQSQRIHKKYNNIQHASKFKCPPLKQRKYRKKFKAQRARKKIYKRMAFDFDDFIFQNKDENRKRIQIRPTIDYQYKSERLPWWYRYCYHLVQAEKTRNSIEKMYHNYYFNDNIFKKSKQQIVSNAIDEVMDILSPEYSHLYQGEWQMSRLLTALIKSLQPKKVRIRRYTCDTDDELDSSDEDEIIQVTDEMFDKCEDLLFDNMWVRHNQVFQLNTLFDGYLRMNVPNNTYIPFDVMKIINTYYVCTVKLVLIEHEINLFSVKHLIDFNKFIYLSLPAGYPIMALKTALTNDFIPLERKRTCKFYDYQMHGSLWFRCNSVAFHINGTYDYNSNHFIQIPSNFEKTLTISDVRTDKYYNMDKSDKIITMLFCRIPRLSPSRVLSKKDLYRRVRYRSYHMYAAAGYARRMCDQIIFNNSFDKKWSKWHIIDTTHKDLKMIYNRDFWKRCMKENDLIDVANAKAKITQITAPDKNGEQWQIHFKMSFRNRNYFSSRFETINYADSEYTVSTDGYNGKRNYLYSTIYPYNKEQKAMNWKMKIFESAVDSTFCFGIDSTMM
eukprot:297970_1